MEVKCDLRAVIPFFISTVQIQPHMFTSSNVGKLFNFQDLQSNESFVENRQPVILQEETQLEVTQYEVLMHHVSGLHQLLREMPHYVH